MSVTRPMVSDSMKDFGLLCRQVTAEPSLLIKQEIISGFLARFSGDTGLLLKLLLPKYAQRVYYIQDKQLLRVLSLVLQTDEDVLRDKLNSNGCIAETACTFFKPTAAMDSDGWCDMTMTEFDNFLTLMAAATVETERVPLLKRFFGVACSHVVYYFFREVKQDLRLGAGLRVVLGGLHPSAYTVFKNCANVQEVVRRIQASATDGAGDDADPSADDEASNNAPIAAAGNDDDNNSNSNSNTMATLTGRGAAARVINTTISIGIPLAPMLAAPARSVDQVLAKCPNGAFSEVKYDGERIQIHKRGNSLTFFARSLRPMRDDKYAGLEPFILQAIQAHDCVLDGEILMVDVRTSVPLPFGTLGKHRRTQFSSACPCVFLFDILYRDGVSLLQVPLEERRETLKKCVRFLRNRVMFSELCLIEGRPEQRRALLQQHLQRAIAEGLEGLVIKDVKSVYEPRARHWLKIKKDYLDGLADSADLLVLGAWYGSGNKGGQLSTFLMGCLDTSLPPNAPGRYKTVCKVGNGLNDTAISAITVAYTARMVSTAAPGSSRDGQRGVPAWLDCQSAHVPEMVLRDPATADVMEIIGAELSVTKTHTSGISIRFPRILKMRTDKTADAATNLRELQELFRTSKEKLSSAGVDTTLHLADSYTIQPDDDENSTSVQLPEIAVNEGTAPPPAVAAARSNAAPDTPPPQPGGSLLSSPERSRRTAPAAVTHVAKGDATKPAIPSTEAFLIFHCVAVQGRWSQRGMMRRISEAFGPAAGKAYEQADANNTLGQVIYAEVGPMSRPGRVFVASAVVQRAVPAGQVPPVDQKAMEKAVKNAAVYAQRHGASLHFVFPSAETQVQVQRTLALLEEICALRDLPITVYGAPASAAAATPSHVAAVSDGPAPALQSFTGGGGGASEKSAPTHPPPPPSASSRSVDAAAPVSENDEEASEEDELPDEPVPSAPSHSVETSLRFSRGRGRRYALMQDVVAQILVKAPDEATTTAAVAAAAAEEVRVLMELMQGRCAAVSTTLASDATCTHVVLVGDGPVPRLEGPQRHSVVVVRERWVRDCYRDAVRYSECVYREDSTRPTAGLLAGQCVLFGTSLQQRNGPQYQRLAGLLGATVHTSWRMTGQRTAFALTDVWDEECAGVYDRGGWVVHAQWLEDCAVAAAVLPLDAYLFSPLVNGRDGGGQPHRPLTGTSLCLLPPVAATTGVPSPLVALCRDELGASLVATAADVDIVVLTADTAETRQTAVAAGAKGSQLVSVEWLRRCAAAGAYVPPGPLPPLATVEKTATAAPNSTAEEEEEESKDDSATERDSSSDDA